MSESDGHVDPWTAPDKVYHILFCFSLTLVFSFLSGVAPHPFLRRRRLFISASLSLSAGAAKEFADHLGFFHSSGASARDAVADVVGVLLALPIANCLVPVPVPVPVPSLKKALPDDDDQLRGIALV